MTDQLTEYTTLENVLAIETINPFIEIVIGSFYINVVEVEGSQIYLGASKDGS